MDRVTRKANLKKLQLPGTGSKLQQCKTRQIAATAANNAISNYFLTPEKSLDGKEHKHDTLICPTNRLTIEDAKFAKTEPKTSSLKSKATRTKLDAFVFKTAQAVPTEIQPVHKPTNDDDFDIPEKKAKKAPPISSTNNAQAKGKKPSRKKKQTTIKSAFLRNEQLFAEIAAQHCAADNFSGDDIQLAIAISKSEAENKGVDVIGENDLLEDGVGVMNDDQKAEKIRQKLEKYGFRTAEPKDYNAFAAAFMPQAKVRRPKSKWANKFTALTLRDDQLQNQKLQQKIKTLSNQNFGTKPLTATEQCFSNFVFQSALLRKCAKEMKRKILHLSESPHIPHELYFVAELFEISKLPSGHLLKDWTAIQGRDLTPKKCSHKNNMKSKLQEMYADLEDYFKSLKARGAVNGSAISEVQLYDQGKEDDDKTVDNVTHIKNFANRTQSAEQNTIKSSDILKNHEASDIFPKELDILDTNNEEKIVPDKQNEDPIPISDTSLSSSICNKIRKILPPLKDIDLTQVSSSSINVEHAIDIDGSPANVPTLGGSCIITDTANCCETLADVTQMSDYSLGVETFINVKPKIFDAAVPTNDFEPLQVLHNCERPENPFNSSQKDNLCDLKLAQVSSNTTQNNRSNSPDLFADSDVEMEDNNILSEGNTSVSNVNAKENNSSLNSSEGLTTYEIYSSDEVKNTSSLVKPSLLTELNQNELNVIDLTQDDERATTQDGLNQNKSIEEVDLFADSPPQDEGDNVIDISNSHQAKYLKKYHNETCKFTLSPYKSNLESPTKNIEHKSFKVSLSMEDKDINQFLDEYDDVVLREIEKTQTNNKSFLNFQGSKQFKTCFHRETAVEPQIAHKEIQVIEKSLPGNETIFRELYSKYLGSSATQKEPSHRANESVLRKSLTQVFPRVITPTRGESGTQFTMDFNITVDHNINNRKSLSFVSKTPENSRDLSNCRLSKSQSFNENNISIDLTQNDDDDEEDDECWVLSDDEINYSIWNANKTGKLDELDADFGKEHGKEKKEHINDAHPSKSSLLDIFNKDTILSQQSYSDFDAECSKPKENHLCSRLVNTSSKNLSSLPKELSPPQQTYSNLVTLQPEQQNTQLERSNFGILEEFSQSIDFTTNMCTPTKLLENVSFLGSPTETSAPMKIFSSCGKSVHQLNDLVNHLDIEAPIYNNWDEYEDFDFQIDDNRNNKSTTTTLPTGLDQLLTAEISFEIPNDESANKKYFSIDSDNMNDGYRASFQTSSLKQKTTFSSHALPEKQELTINNKTYSIRYAATPKPNYTLYSEAELLKELYNFGIKPLKRKQAVKMLEYIYIQTHPIIVDDKIAENPVEDLVDTAPLSKCKSKFCLSSKDSIEELSSQNHTATESSINHSFTKKVTVRESNNCDIGKKLNLQDACGMKMLRYSLEIESELADEQYILQTNVSKKTPQPLMPFHIAWFNLVCSNPNLHENILMYEPIDLQEIYIFLKGLGYRYDPKDIKQFFDRRCIIFRYDLAAAGGNKKANGNNRHVRKKKSFCKK